MSPTLTANSHVDTEAHEFVWNIDNFNFLSNDKNFLDTHAFLFTAGSSLGVPSKWRLYFARNSALSCTTLCFQLVEYNGTDQVPVTLEVIVDNGPRSKFEYKMNIHYFAPTWAIQCDDFLGYYKEKNLNAPWMRMQNYPSGVFTLPSICKTLGRDTLKLIINVRVFGKPTFTANGILSSSSTTLEMEREKSVQRHKKVILAMLESGDRSDVTFETRDDQRVTAHRLILSMQSTVFAAMFASEMKEKVEGVVKLDDIGGDGVKILLKFLYTGELDEKWSEFYEEIVNAANKYQIMSLMEMCGKLLPTLVSWENCFELLNLTELYDMTGAKEEIENFMKSDPEKLLQLCRSSHPPKRPRYTEFLTKM